MPGASLVRFVALAALIVSVALALWLLDAGRGWIVAGVIAAWVVSSLVEWVAWSRFEAEWPGEPSGPRSGHDRLVPSPPPLRAAVPRPLPYPVAPVIVPSSARRAVSPRARTKATADQAEEQGEPPRPALDAVPAAPTEARAPGREPAAAAEPRSLADLQPASPERKPASPSGSPVAEASSRLGAPPPAVPAPDSREPSPMPRSGGAGTQQEPPPELRAGEAHERSFRLFGLRVTLVAPPQRSRDDTTPPAVSPVSQAPPLRQLESEPDSEPEPEPEPEAEPERESRPDAEPEPVPVAAPPPHDRGSAEPRRWNLWELERAARGTAATVVRDPDERSFLLLHLRQFAAPDGLLPADFDELVRESFGPLVGELEQA